MASVATTLTCMCHRRDRSSRPRQDHRLLRACDELLLAPGLIDPAHVHALMA
jgi:hypothetical protein